MRDYIQNPQTAIVLCDIASLCLIAQLEARVYFRRERTQRKCPVTSSSSSSCRGKQSEFTWPKYDHTYILLVAAGEIEKRYTALEYDTLKCQNEKKNNTHTELNGAVSVTAGEYTRYK